MITVCVCSCCYDPEVLDLEYAKKSLSINYISKFRKDNNRGYFIIEINEKLFVFDQEGAPFFHNKNGVSKLKHEFLANLGYYWEERSAQQDADEYIKNKLEEIGVSSNVIIPIQITPPPDKEQVKEINQVMRSGWWYAPPLEFKKGTPVSSIDKK